MKPEKGSKIKSLKPLGPSVILEDVSWQGLGNCASTPLISSQNFQPVLRNPVDLINATYGQLLSYVVPDVNIYTRIQSWTLGNTLRIKIYPTVIYLTADIIDIVKPKGLSIFLAS